MKRNQAKKLFEIICKKEGLKLPWLARGAHLPGNFGRSKARDCMPSIWQGICGTPRHRVEPGIDFDRKLYVARRVFEQSSDRIPMCAVLLQPHHCLQGHVPGGTAAPVLSRSAGAQIMNLPSRMVHSPFFHQHRHPAGSGPIPTALSCTTARSTPSAATRTRCWPGRKPCAPTI